MKRPGRRISAFFMMIFLLSASLSAENILKDIYISHNRLLFVFSKKIRTSDIHHFVLKGKRSTRYVFDFKDTKFKAAPAAKKLRYNGKIRSIRASQYNSDTSRVVIETSKPYPIVCRKLSTAVYGVTLPAGSSDQVSPVKGLFEALNKILPIKLSSSSGSSKRKSASPKKKTAEKKSPYLMSAHRALPKKHCLVVIDPGHGGRDSGAIGGSRRYMEKKAVLQIALRLRRHLKAIGFAVLMTRSSDRFVKLRYRTRYANRKHGDIFVSIHANAAGSRRKYRAAYGIETYFLQVTRNERAKRVAAMENSVVLNKKDRLSKNVILNAVLTGPKIVLSNKLAIDVQQGMLSNLRRRYRGVKDGGVRPAPFWVLVGAEMPAILIETGYISNPWEKKRLFDPRYQDLMARGIAEGIARYLRNREKEME